MATAADLRYVYLDCILALLAAELAALGGGHPQVSRAHSLLCSCAMGIDLLSKLF